MSKRPHFNYAFLTVTRTIDARLISEFLKANTKDNESMQSRLNVLLAYFAEEVGLGFLPAPDGITFVFYEEAFISYEMASEYLDHFAEEVAA